MAGQLVEVPFLIEGLGRVRKAIEDDGHKRERVTSLIAVAESLGPKADTHS
jgi:hypothetical protein